jgi:hypothetical protein
MASYVFSFTAASDNVNTFKYIDLEPSLGNYAQTNSGHQAIDISVTASATGTAHALTIVWADCDLTAQNGVLNVTKYDTITATPSARRTGLDGSSGGYVCTVSAASSSSSLVKTVGVGACTDLRTATVSVPARKMFIGLTTLGDGNGTVTVIVTPTKIL